jgi:hypothetical protein
MLKTRQIKVMGFDKELVGQVRRKFASVRPPEPYHGKGIRYLGERIRRKAGKAGKEPSKPWLIKRSLAREPADMRVSVSIWRAPLNVRV